MDRPDTGEIGRVSACRPEMKGEKGFSSNQDERFRLKLLAKIQSQAINNCNYCGGKDQIKEPFPWPFLPFPPSVGPRKRWEQSCTVRSISDTRPRYCMLARI